MPKKVTVEMFIERAKKIHGDKYDYSKVNFDATRDKVLIKCNKCGLEFWQVAASHLRGRGCDRCARELQRQSKYKTFEDFVTRAKLVHGDKYEYFESEYYHRNNNALMKCKECGLEFWQTPANHLKGEGCPVCRRKHALERKRAVYANRFVKRAKEIHGDKYDYTNFKYTKAKEKSLIHCNVCGSDFWATPDGHIGHKRQGCPVCKANKLREMFSFDTEMFIKLAREVHGDKYDYSEVDYKNMKSEVKIGCPKHGWFYQIPEVHLRSLGCPFCSVSTGETRILNFLNEHNIDFKSEYYVWYDDNSFGRIDFMLNNGAIEFDGKQHFESIEFFGGMDVLKYNMDRDRKKDDYCADHGIPLLRIRYDQMDNIEHILKHFLENPGFYKNRHNPYLTNEDYYSIREVA